MTKTVEMMNGRVRRILAAMCGGLVIVAAMSGPAIAQERRAGAVNVAAEAQRVAHALVAARTSAQRQKALESLFSALGVQTIDYQGHAVTPRPSGQMRLYVYPYELTLAATAFGQHAGT